MRPACSRVKQRSASEAAFAHSLPPEMKLGATDTDLRGAQRIVPTQPVLELLPHLGAAPLTQQAAQRCVVEIRVPHVVRIASQVPEVRLVESQGKRVAVPPHHGPNIAVAQRQALVPMRLRRLERYAKGGESNILACLTHSSAACLQMVTPHRAGSRQPCLSPWA